MEDGVLAAPLDQTRLEYQVAARARVRYQHLALFQHFFDGDKLGFIGVKKVVLEGDTRVERLHGFPDLFHGGAHHVDFVGFGIHDDEGLDLVGVQEAYEPILEFQAGVLGPVHSIGHVAVDDHGVVGTAHVLVVPEGLHRTVLVLAVELFTVDGVIGGCPRLSELLGPRGHEHDVLGMYVLVHVRVEIVQQVLSRGPLALPAHEPVGDEHRLGATAYQLVDREGDTAAFEHPAGLFAVFNNFSHRHGQMLPFQKGSTPRAGSAPRHADLL